MSIETKRDAWLHGHRPAARETRQTMDLADDLVERAGVLEPEHDADADDVADGAAGQRVGEREPGGFAGLQAGVAGLQLQPRRRLPVRRQRQPEPPSDASASSTPP